MNTTLKSVDVRHTALTDDASPGLLVHTCGSWMMELLRTRVLATDRSLTCEPTRAVEGDGLSGEYPARIKQALQRLQVTSRHNKAARLGCTSSAAVQSV